MAMTAMHNIEPYADSTSLLNHPEALRQRGRKDGCLFFKGLLPPDALLDVRRQILELCKKHGWLQKGSELMHGIAQEGFSSIEAGDPRWKDFYCDVLKLRDFQALALHASIVDMLEVLFGEKALPHSRNICRVMFPQTKEHSTPPHQDHFYIGGSDETWTAWIPLGDCPVELGSLAVAHGTHTRGMMDVHEAKGAGGRAVDMGKESRWFSSDFSCGDVVILHSMTVHQGRDNQTADRLRLSVDYRYQPRSHPLREDSLLPHMGWIDWEEIYADWAANDPVKYYWKNWDLDVQPIGSK
jgi:hypothetical protein